MKEHCWIFLIFLIIFAAFNVQNSMAASAQVDGWEYVEPIGYENVQRISSKGINGAGIYGGAFIGGLSSGVLGVAGAFDGIDYGGGAIAIGGTIGAVAVSGIGEGSVSEMLFETLPICPEGYDVYGKRCRRAV